MNTYNDFPEHSKAWVYQSNRILTAIEVNEIEKLARIFLAEWESHGSPVKGFIEVRENAFIIILADDSDDKMCGRAIDGSVRFMKELQQLLGIPFLDRMNTAWKKNNELVLGHINEFRDKAGNKEIDNTTIVYNNTITTKRELDNRWKTAAEESWHATLL